MKLHFESNLDFQTQAIEAACGLFRGQEICRTEFTVTHDPTRPQAQFAFAQNVLGIVDTSSSSQEDQVSTKSTMKWSAVSSSLW